MKDRLIKNILILKVKNQDPEAYGQLYDLYVKRIYRFIFFKINSTAEAQDLTSETFLKVWQYIKEGKDIKNLNALIYLTARNLVIDFYRSKAKQTQVDSDDEDLKSRLADDSQDLLAQQEIESELKQVLSGLETLKDEYKEIIILRFIDELSISEISDIINKSKGATRVLLHRALKTLKDNLTDD